MPWIDQQQQASAYETINSVGPVAQALPLIATPPSTIAAGGSWTSGVMISDGFKAIAVGVTSSQPGQVSVNRFIDRTGLVAISGASVTLTAGAPGYTSIADNTPFAAFSISVTNTGASSAVVTNFAALMNAA